MKRSDASPITVGVELFGPTGGAPINDVSSGDGSLSVAPGQTVSIGTSFVTGFFTDEQVSAGGAIRFGSARIVSTSKKIVCTAMLVERLSSPPTVMSHLTIIAKTKQKASN